LSTFLPRIPLSSAPLPFLLAAQQLTETHHDLYRTQTLFIGIAKNRSSTRGPARERSAEIKIVERGSLPQSPPTVPTDFVRPGCDCPNRSDPE
jgi:hypothetical protein